MHLAAEANLNRCQDNPETSHQINVQVPCHIADLCAEADIPCAFASSAQVFDGLTPPYREADPVSPVSLYGEQKALAEVEMLKRYPKTAAQGLLLALPQVQGIIHLGGKERISRYDFGHLMVEIFELPTAGLTSCWRLAVKMSAPGPRRIPPWTVPKPVGWATPLGRSERNSKPCAVGFDCDKI